MPDIVPGESLHSRVSHAHYLWGIHRAVIARAVIVMPRLRRRRHMGRARGVTGARWGLSVCILLHRDIVQAVHRIHGGLCVDDRTVTLAGLQLPREAT